MSKVKPKVPSGHLVLLTAPNTKGECAVYVRYFLGKYVKRSTGVSIPADGWDEKRECVKPTVKNAPYLNSVLRDFKAEIDNKLMKFDGVITLQVLTFILNGGDPNNAGELPADHPDQIVTKNTSFVEYCRMLNDLRYGMKEFSYSGWYNRNSYIRIFENFLLHYAKLPKFAIKDLKKDIFDRFIEYRFTVRGNTSKEAINKGLVPLYQAVQSCVDYGYVELKQVAPILTNYLETHETEYKPDAVEAIERVRYLNPAQLEQLKDYQSKCRNPRSKEILDMWFFAYHACGMRISDIMTLEWKHIDWDAKVIKKVQFKTKRLPDILPPIGKAAMEILERWKGYNRNSRFVFDLLPEDYDMRDQNRLFKDRNSKDKTFNTSLNVARMTLRFPFPLTMHVARHTFAVSAINKGMSIYMLSKLMGHSTIHSTERTYAQFLREKVDRDTRELLDF